MDDELQQLMIVVEKCISSYHPDDFLEQYVVTVKDLYLERFWVRELPPTDSVLFRTISIVHEAAIGKERFRTLQCLTIIKKLVRKRWEIAPLPDKVKSLLFDLFKLYHDHGNVEVEWAVAVFLKNQILNDLQVSWLVNNWQSSVHIVNRLLLYPSHDSQIAVWAEKMLKENGLSDRRSELIALVITDEIPAYLRNETRSSLLWGIYKAKIESNLKVELMKSHIDLNPTTVTAVIEISGRLGRPDLLYTIKEQIQILQGKP